MIFILGPAHILESAGCKVGHTVCFSKRTKVTFAMFSGESC
jgi:hypothetical protein